MQTFQRDTQQNELLTQEEAAEYLRISIRKLQRSGELGEGPPRAKLGRRVVYPRADLMAWINERTV